MTENEKNLKEIEEMHTNGMISDEIYAWQKKDLEDAIAKEREQAQAATGGTTPKPVATSGPPVTQAPPSLATATPTITQAPAPSPQIPKIRVSIGGKEIGAFEREEVIKKIRAGEIRSDARVFKDGMPDWVNAGDLPELETYIGDVKNFFEAKDLYREAVKYREQARDYAFYAKYPDEYNKGDLTKVEPCWAKYSELIIKAAEMGNAKAQAEVAEGYDCGNYRFPKDEAKAKYWGAKAAKQGDPEDPKDCYDLGCSYYFGSAGRVYGLVDIDKYKKAEELFNKAIAGAGNDKDLLKDAKKYLKEVEKLLGKRGLFGKKK